MFIPDYKDEPFQLPFPMPSQFVVLRMDPVAMVKPLRDPQATAEAKTMRPKKYLMFLSSPVDLPSPTSQWCRYETWPVATTLRPADPKLGIAEDMVMPISPNTQYLKSRSPVTPQPSFPFGNCFLWIDSTILLRVKVREEGYDDSQATKLTAYDHCKLHSCFDGECQRKVQIMREYEATHPADTSVSRAGDESGMEYRLSPRGSHVSWNPSPSSREPSPPSSISDPEDGSVRTNMEPLFERSANGSTSSISSVESIDDLRGYNLFGWDPDPTVLFLPLVDIWFELPEHLDESSIPSPLDFHKEEAMVRSMIERSLERMIAADCVSRPDRYSLAVPAYVGDHMASDSDAFDGSPTVDEPDPQSEEDTEGAFTAVHYPANLPSQNEVMIPCAPSPSPQTSVELPIGLNESREESKNTGKRKDLQDFDHSDRPLKKRIFYWPTLVVVRAAEYAGKVRFSTRRQFWKRCQN